MKCKINKFVFPSCTFCLDNSILFSPLFACDNSIKMNGPIDILDKTSSSSCLFCLLLCNWCHFEFHPCGKIQSRVMLYFVHYQTGGQGSILCLTSRTTVTSARILDEDACHRAHISRVQKGTPGLTHKGCVFQRISLGALSDVMVVLGMRKSIVRDSRGSMH